MIPNDFGLIRQREKTLIALFLYPITNIEEYHVEVIHPEYVNGAYIASDTGNISTPSDASPQQAAKIDVSKYDFVLAPCAMNISPETRTGLSAGNTGFANTMFGAVKGYVGVDTACYVLFDRRNNRNLDTLNINGKRGQNAAVLGFIHHRSDNVNPKGIIKDVNSDILQPVKEDELNGKADRIRNDLSGNAESPDLDSKSGSGAEERTGS